MSKQTLEIHIPKMPHDVGCPMGSYLEPYVCSGRGICSDGITGTGTCQCRGNVVGSICESCASSDQYGPNCENSKQLAFFFFT